MGVFGFSAPLIAALVVTAGLVLVAPSAAACDPVDVQTEQDACATVLAVSVRGDARGDGACNDTVSCIAVSGTGDASNEVGGAECGGESYRTLIACLAVSGTGNASNAGGAWSCGTAPTPTIACLAVSGTGNASNGEPDYGWGPDARCGTATEAAGIVTFACWSVSGTGDASFGGADHSCETFGSCVAVSGAGEARGRAERCYMPFPGPCGTCVSPERVEPIYCGHDVL